MSRANALVRTLQLSEPVLVSQSELLDGVHGEGQVRGVKIPLELASAPIELGEWLDRLLQELSPEWVFIDAFPSGVIGELAYVPGLKSYRCAYLARLLNWEAYAPVLKETRCLFERVYLLEALEEKHQAYVEGVAGEVVELSLDYFPLETREGLALAARIESIRVSSSAQVWLVVHSGAAEEVEELLAYAQGCAEIIGLSPRWMVVSPHRLKGMRPEVEWHCVYPVASAYEVADRIFTAGGFNCMAETAPYREKHSALPFPRKYDLQGVRIARCKMGL